MGAKDVASAVETVVNGLLTAPDPKAVLRSLIENDEDRGKAVVRELLARMRRSIRRSPVEARWCGELAEQGSRQLGDPKLRAASLRLLAQTHLVNGDSTDALVTLAEGAGIARDAGDEVEAANLDAYAVTALVNLERYDDARRLAHACLDAFARHEEVMGLLRTHVALADVEFRTDRPRQALRHQACADALVPDGPQAPALRATIAANRANALAACNRFRAAKRHHHIARTYFESIGADHTVAQVDFNAAYRDFLAGRYEDSLRRYDDLESAFQRLNDERQLAQVDLDRAEVHIHLNLPEDAHRLASAAERRFEALELTKESAQAAHVQGRALEMLGRMDEAKSAYARAREGFAALDLTEREIGCLVQVGRIEHTTGHPTEAHDLWKAAAERLTPEMNPLTRIAVELLRADLDLEAGRIERATTRCKKVLLASRRLHAPRVKIQAWRSLARAQSLAGDPHEALASLEAAIEALEWYRGGVPPDEYMAAFLAARVELYEEIVDLLLTLGEPERAFEYAERSKARALLDLIGQSARRRGPNSPAAARIEQLRTRLHATYQRMFQASRDAELPAPGHLKTLRGQAHELEEELARRLRRSWRQSPDTLELQSVPCPDLDSLRADLPTDTCLVEYFVATDWLAVFVVTRDGIRAVRHAVGRRDLRRRLERFHFHLSKFMRPYAPSEASVMAQTRANLAVLSDSLLTPVPHDDSVHRLIVVPHGVLHHLPFHALPLGDGWLADRYELIYSPSASVYRRAAHTRAPARGRPFVLGLADPEAPQIEREARLVAGRLDGAELLLGDDASFDTLRNGARRARILHIATHGMFRPSAPMLSAIRLADRWITLYDLYDLEIDSELVVLSTCESGAAHVTGGDEILGLTRGFLHAGARTLLTSQWRVDDVATATFMESFYGALAQGCQAATALRRGMSVVRKAHPHPFFWAPFFLTGRQAPGSPRSASPIADFTTAFENSPRPPLPAADKEVHP